MKNLLLRIFAIVALPQLVVAGGNTSIVEIKEVSEIKIEDKKVIIKGSAVVRRRIMSPAEKGDTTVFGQPAQWIYAKADNAIFEIVPYFTPGIKGVPGGGREKEMKRLRDKQWTGLLASAATTKKGDTITIGYQGDQTIFDSFYLSKIVGFGSLTKK